MLNRLGAALAAVLAVASLHAPAARAQVQPTVEGAHQFLIQVLRNGSSSFETDNPANPTYRELVQITSVSSSGCQTVLYGRGQISGRTFRRTINWGKVLEVGGTVDVDVIGPIIVTDGGVVEELNLGIGGWEMADRVRKAALFLRDACDTTRQTGF